MSDDLPPNKTEETDEEIIASPMPQDDTLPYDIKPSPSIKPDSPIEKSEPDRESEPGTFASRDAPWVGTEKSWRRNANHSRDPASQPAIQPTAQSTRQPSKPPPKNSIIPETESFPPSESNANIFPSLAPPPEKEMSPESKLGLTAIILVIFILVGLTVWWMLDLRAQSAHARYLSESLSQRMSAQDEFQRAQYETIIRLQKQIAQITSNSRINIEDRPQADVETARVGATAMGLNTNTPEGDSSRYDKKPYRSQAKAKTDKAPPSDVALEAKSPEVQPSGEITEPPPSKPAESKLPNVPSPEQVKSAMDAVAKNVKRCAKGSGGRILLKIAVSGQTGRIMSANPINKEYMGTAVGLCATRAVKLAEFPKFSQNILVTKYSFDL